jgi:hypothetical protein
LNHQKVERTRKRRMPPTNIIFAGGAR